MSIEFTNKELQDLITMLDVATKAGGLAVAQTALPLAIKVQTALQQEPPLSAEKLGL